MHTVPGQENNTFYSYKVRKFIHIYCHDSSTYSSIMRLQNQKVLLPGRAEKKGSGVYDLIFISGKTNLSVMTRGFSGTPMKILHYLRRVEMKDEKKKKKSLFS